MSTKLSERGLPGFRSGKELDDEVKQKILALKERDAATCGRLVSTALRYCGKQRISELSEEQLSVLMEEVENILSLPF